ncbi:MULTISPECIES: hypothetical protein [unclassified Streptomyces]|uniref:hypothetical protein n=1 Tax=unclassified Streptomyces TaxID=2593676 RepID=UPI0038291090
MVHLEQPQLSGLGRNPAAPTNVLVRLAAHAAGRSGLMRREGQLPDAVAEALLIHGRGDAAVRLHGRRVSPAMRRRIAEHPDPAIRDAFADFVRSMVESGAGLGIEALLETYGLSPTTPRPTPYCPERGWTASPPKPASEAPHPARAPTPAPYGAYSTGGRGEITRSPS